MVVGTGEHLVQRRECGRDRAVSEGEYVAHARFNGAAGAAAIRQEVTGLTASHALRCRLVGGAAGRAQVGAVSSASDDDARPPA
jgi:hypothetical protein